MSFKKDLLDHPKEYPYIPEFDLYNNLDMMEQCMLSYLIDNDDRTKRNGDWMEITPSYIRLKRPGWKEKTIRTALKKLVEKGLVLKKKSNGRGNFYKLNLDKLYELMNIIKNDE